MMGVNNAAMLGAQERDGQDLSIDNMSTRRAVELC